MKKDILDEIDALVDAQLQQEASGYDHNVNQPMCPRCGRHFHGLPLTEHVAVMYAFGSFDPTYIAADDDSPIVCEGAHFIRPLRPPSEMMQKLEVLMRMQTSMLSLSASMPSVPGRLWVLPDEESLYPDNSVRIERKPRRWLDWAVLFGPYIATLGIGGFFAHPVAWAIGVTTSYWGFTAVRAMVRRRR